MASDILSYNVVQDHEGISIKGYRGLRPQGDLIYSDQETFLCRNLGFVCFVAWRHGDNLEISRSCLFGGRTGTSHQKGTDGAAARESTSTSRRRGRARAAAGRPVSPVYCNTYCYIR